MSDTVEVVRVLCRARDSIARADKETGDFNFGNWSKCACGHIARAAGMSATDEDGHLVLPAGLYLDALSAVATKGAIEKFGSAHAKAPAYGVSFTVRCAVRAAGERADNETLRQASLMVLNNAIAKLQTPEVEDKEMVAARV